MHLTVSPTAFDGTDSVVFYYLPVTIGRSSSFDGFASILWNPQMQTTNGNFGVQNNQFGFNITGTTNIPIVVKDAPIWQMPLGQHCNPAS